MGEGDWGRVSTKVLGHMLCSESRSCPLGGKRGYGGSDGSYGGPRKPYKAAGTLLSRWKAGRYQTLSDVVASDDGVVKC